MEPKTTVMLEHLFSYVHRNETIKRADGMDVSRMKVYNIKDYVQS